ncbi:unnamed protein product [Calypogeia fissa]
MHRRSWVVRCLGHIKVQCFSKLGLDLLVEAGARVLVEAGAPELLVASCWSETRRRFSSTLARFVHTQTQIHTRSNCGNLSQLAQQRNASLNLEKVSKAKAKT